MQETFAFQQQANVIIILKTFLCSTEYLALIIIEHFYHFHHPISRKY